MTETSSTDLLALRHVARLQKLVGSCRRRYHEARMSGAGAARVRGTLEGLEAQLSKALPSNAQFNLTK